MAIELFINNSCIRYIHIQGLKDENVNNYVIHNLYKVILLWLYFIIIWEWINRFIQEIYVGNVDELKYNLLINTIWLFIFINSIINMYHYIHFITILFILSILIHFSSSFSFSWLFSFLFLLFSFHFRLFIFIILFSPLWEKRKQKIKHIILLLKISPIMLKMIIGNKGTSQFLTFILFL